MPNNNYIRGRSFEYQIVKHFRNLGYEAFRTAGSHGPFDVIAIHPETGSIELAQCKLVSTPAESKSLIKDFRKNPPFKAKLLPMGVHQWMMVKVRGEGEWERTVV